KRKQVEIDNQITKFLNPTTSLNRKLWWSTESSIRISHFQDFYWHVFKPERIIMLSQTFNNHCMCCHVPFSCNKLKSTRRKVPCQICRIPTQIGAHTVLQSLQQSPLIEPGYNL
ncbi:hypothetical protein ES319_D08G059600v1, partial [Gossypium barbadense]